MKVSKNEMREAADYMQQRADAALKLVKALGPNAPLAEKQANDEIRKESKMCYIAEHALRRNAEFLP